MLARLKSRQVIGIMKGRNRQVHNNVNLRIRDQFRPAGVGLLKAEFPGLSPGLFQAGAGAAVKFYHFRVILQIIQIDCADIAQTDNAYFQCSHKKFSS